MEELNTLNRIVEGIMVFSIAMIIWIFTSHTFGFYGALIILTALTLWAYVLHKAYKHLERS